MSQSGSLGFGNYFTPHMVVARWSPADGWLPLELTDHSALTLAPSAMALHYGQAVFEGLKAYARPGGVASLFRPRRCAARFNRSAVRLSMPVMPEDFFIAACESLVLADREHVPTGPGESLYLRPFMIATEASISVRASADYLFAAIASPAGNFFPSTAGGISAWCPSDYVRAVAGGTGEAKCAANYAGSLIAKAEAARRGCQEVLWLDAAERRWVEELSAMNFFCVTRHLAGPTELVTPPLTGTILDGNTRDSLLQLAARRGIRTVQRPVALAEITCPRGPVTEAFACGTAAAIAPIARIVTRDGCHQIGDGVPGPVTTSLRADLMGIQEGSIPDEFGWMHDVRPAGQPADTAGARRAGPIGRHAGRTSRQRSRHHDASL
jgi:branched-chain amino acid aminotransferase